MEFSTWRICCLGVWLVLLGCYFVWIAIKVFILGMPHVGINYKVAIFMTSIFDKEKVDQMKEYAYSDKIMRREAAISGIGGALFILVGLWNLFSVL